MNLIKRILKIYFYRIFSLRIFHHKKYYCNYPIKKYGIKNKHVFFGYYDILPFDEKNERLLACLAPGKYTDPAKTELIVGYFNTHSGKFHKIGQTAAWCWQQGCRLQWFKDSKDHLVIFNIFKDKTFGSSIMNAENGKIVQENFFPVYDIDNAFEYALHLNFARLGKLRPGYGYTNLNDPNIDIGHPSNDGIWLSHFKTRRTDLIIDLNMLRNFEPLSSMKGAAHYINHISFNPSGNQFLFFHLWNKDKKSYNRLLTASKDGTNLQIHENQGKVSHYTWKSDSEILATVFDQNFVLSYILYDIISGQKVEIAHDYFTMGDGHPTFSANSKKILTDTYPDKYGEQYLMIYDSKLKIVGKFFSPPIYTGEYRCDLHPRWSLDNKHICIDSTESGKRCLYLISIDK